MDDQPKRKQVKNACSKSVQKTFTWMAKLTPYCYVANCQKACKKCEDIRPCPRCVRAGLSDTCVSSVRKERVKGVKRGPYKRKGRQGM
jgi:hypothetical protein